MNISNVTDDIYQLSVNLEEDLFEGIWEVPSGVSVNSYIVKGEKTAIIDGVCGWDGVPETFFEMLKKIDVELDSIEYIVINHMEPDHSGWIEDLKKITNNFKIVCSKRAIPMLEAFFGHKENIIPIKSGDELDLGGRKLKFVEIPNVHWPETMVTYDEKTKTLFSCDAFGSYGAVDDKNYDDLVTHEELIKFEKEAKRYYANIVASFSNFVDKAIQKLSDLDIKIIAPGHGLVWRKDPSIIINDYKRYVSYASGVAKREITVIWGSMYGMTEKGVKRIVELLEKEEDITVNVHRVPEDSISEILASVWSSSGLVLAMPTYEMKMFPPMAYVLEEMGRKKMGKRFVFRTGSYGWSKGAQKELDEINEKYKLEFKFIDPVEFKGAATEEVLKDIEAGVKMLCESVRNIT